MGIIILGSFKSPPPKLFIDYFFTNFLMVMNAIIKLCQKEFRDEGSLVHQNQQLIHQYIESFLKVHENAQKTVTQNEFLESIIGNELEEVQRKLLAQFNETEAQKKAGGIIEKEGQPMFQR